MIQNLEQATKSTEIISHETRLEWVSSHQLTTTASTLGLWEYNVVTCGSNDQSVLAGGFQFYSLNVAYNQCWWQVTLFIKRLTLIETLSPTGKKCCLRQAILLAIKKGRNAKKCSDHRRLCKDLWAQSALILEKRCYENKGPFLTHHFMFPPGVSSCLTQYIYSDFTFQIRWKQTHWYDNSNGTFQGCIYSP